MKRKILLGTVAALTMSAGTVLAGTLDDVMAKGHLQCGVNTGLVGFAAPDENGVWEGFDVAYCRALAAAIFGDPMAVKFTPLTGKTRFTALASGEIDILSRNTTWTFSRDVDLKQTFVGINYYDGQGFMAKKSLGVSSASELDGASVCIQTGTTTELNLADFFRSNGMEYDPIPIETNAEAREQFFADACDVYTTDRSGLAATRASHEDPDSLVVLPEIVSKEPLGTARPPWRRSVGGHCALGSQCAHKFRRTRNHGGERHGNGRGHQQSGSQPPAGLGRQFRRNDWIAGRLGRPCDHGSRQLRRDFRQLYRREYSHRPGPRPKRALD